LHTEFWLGTLKGRDHLEDVGVRVRIILKFILCEVGSEGVDWIHPAPVATLAGCYEHGDEPLVP
jgi:hypothetical protein